MYFILLCLLKTVCYLGSSLLKGVAMCANIYFDVFFHQLPFYFIAQVLPDQLVQLALRALPVLKDSPDLMEPLASLE